MRKPCCDRQSKRVFVWEYQLNPMSVQMPRTLCLLMFSVMLAACGKNQDSPPAAPASAAANLRPADAALASVYDQSCKACHATPASGAPQTGDRAAWAPRLAQGMDTLLEHTVSGYKGMPPLGSCGDCSEDEFAALIRFMSAEPGL